MVQQLDHMDVDKEVVDLLKKINLFVIDFTYYSMNSKIKKIKLVVLDIPVTKIEFTCDSLIRH
jgi:hypothetical protein